MLTLVPVLLAMKRRKVQIEDSIKEVIYEQEIDQKEILKHLSNRYQFKISLNILKYINWS